MAAQQGPPQAASGTASQPAAAALPGASLPDSQLKATLASSPDQVILLAPAAAVAAAHQSSAAPAESLTTQVPGWGGVSGASIAAAVACDNMAGSQLLVSLPGISQQDAQGSVHIKTAEDGASTKAEAQQATVNTCVPQPPSGGTGKASVSLYAFAGGGSAGDRLQGLLSSKPNAQDMQGMYVFGRREREVAEHAAAAEARQAAGQGDGQTDSQAERQIEGQGDGQAREQVERQAEGQAEGQNDGQAEGQHGQQAEGQADVLGEGQTNSGHGQNCLFEQQTIKHEVPLQVRVPSLCTPPADRETPPHTQGGVPKPPPYSTAAATASLTVGDAAAAVTDDTVIPAAASLADVAAAAAAAAAAAEAMAANTLPEVAAVAGVAQDRLAQLKVQHDGARLWLEDKPFGTAPHPAAKAPSTAAAAASDESEPAREAAREAAAHVSQPAPEAAREAALHASEPACQAAPEESTPASVPCMIPADKSLAVSPIAAAAGVKSKKRQSKYFSETFDQKKRRITRLGRTKAENRASRAVGAALPLSASTKGRSADISSISGESGTAVSASVSASISTGPCMLRSTLLPFSVLNGLWPRPFTPQQATVLRIFPSSHLENGLLTPSPPSATLFLPPSHCLTLCPLSSSLFALSFPLYFTTSSLLCPPLISPPPLASPPVLASF